MDFADERGAGLAGVYDAIINRDVDAFGEIASQVRSLFPSVAKIGLTNVTSSTKAIAVTLRDGTVVPAGAMSEGLLYFLGFAALPYIRETRLILVEEPENGLHPARVAEVMGVLRKVSEHSQVVMATHSPLVVNELEGHEVSVITRDESGTHATLIKDTPSFEERSQVYALGELWVSYSDGERETPLLEGGPRP